MSGTLPHYRHWSEVPDNLLTETALKKLGLLAGGLAVSTVTYNRGRDTTVLYDRTKAVPKPPRTLAQQAGVLKARETREAKAAAQQKAEAARWGRYYDRKKAELCERLNADKLAARQTFQRWAADPQAVVLDTETTGLSGKVIEIGLCTVAGESLFERRIRVDEPVEVGAFEVHGISDADLAHCPAWDVVWPELKPLLAGKTVIAFNAGFDEAALERSVRHLFPAERFEKQTEMLENGSTRHLWPLPLFDWECAMLTYAAWWQAYSRWHDSYTWQSLKWASHGLALPERQTHGALDDAQRTAAVIRHVASAELNLWTPEDISDDWI
ncbi:3'-5' exonuclease (plasmid) [Deinococcus sp. KNUC1210]|uniref:3'-5' exonuclease n=1 Tax=Deinococcus sp. KNUC1210 TaxID=2917691 RepID=UPI001EEFD7C0|nr:3'-5' exonuclease [Deinococcus sp. KNUC1210]ULH17437.1 3'-5' exonuclease [Deinococcus sp. KNUC1210]